MDLHKSSTAGTHEEAIAGTTTGLLGLNARVTWRAKHFGLMLTHAALISEYERPVHFQDIMTKGAFKRFVHDHDFEILPDGRTLMRDTLRFEAPLGPLGRIAEVLVLRRYLARFLEERNRVLKEIAEDERRWREFLPRNLCRLCKEGAYARAAYIAARAKGIQIWQPKSNFIPRP